MCEVLLLGVCVCVCVCVCVVDVLCVFICKQILVGINAMVCEKAQATVRLTEKRDRQTDRREHESLLCLSRSTASPAALPLLQHTSGSV